MWMINVTETVVQQGISENYGPVGQGGRKEGDGGLKDYRGVRRV